VNFDLKIRFAAIFRLALPMLLLGPMQSGWAQEAAPSPSSMQAPASDEAAAAQPPVPVLIGDALFERYPAGGIDSVETANAALADTGRERARIDVELIRQQRVCYAKFFVSSCLNKVAAAHRAESKKLKNIEIEANTYLRQVRADDRDAALAEQRAKEIADAPRRAEEQRKNALENKRKVEESASRSAEAEARAQEATPTPNQRIADHEQKMQQVRAKQEADARMHDANVAAYNKKMKDAQERQKEVADKKAQKAADLAAQKAADADAKKAADQAAQKAAGQQ
jgi:membrane protein involved in colicin uptake